MPDEDFPPIPHYELTLQEAAAVFNIDSEELYLALEELEAKRDRDAPGLILTGQRALYRRAARRAGAVVTVYRREDCEEAVALRAAKDLGFDG